MTWDSVKIDNSPEDLENGILNADDWNGIVTYVKSGLTDLGVIDGGDATG